MNGSCFFMGHRDTPESIYPKLCEAVEHMVACGARDFYVGMHGRFDSMARRSVAEAKRRHPDIRLHALMVYHPCRTYQAPNNDFDTIYYPFDKPVPPRYALVRANRHMISVCTHAIFHVLHPGNAANLLTYARRREQAGMLQIENI